MCRTRYNWGIETEMKIMTEQEFAAQVETMISNLNAIKASADFACQGSAWALQQTKYPLASSAKKLYL